jgi:copper chaperone NosL
MIISDERWATATIVAGARGPESLVFDDYNCQVHYETEHAGLEIVTRWSHDYAARTWMKSDWAVFVFSPSLRTPMGSGAAAFATESEAEAARGELQGEVLTFAAAWERLGSAQTRQRP